MGLLASLRIKSQSSALRKARRSFLLALGAGVPLGKAWASSRGDPEARALAKAALIQSAAALKASAPAAGAVIAGTDATVVGAPALVRHLGDAPGQRWPLRSLIAGKAALLADGSSETAKISGAFSRIAESDLVCDLGPGVFGYDALLPPLSAGSLQGEGASSIFQALNPECSVISLRGKGQFLRDFRGRSPNAKRRSTTDMSSFIQVGYADRRPGHMNCTDFDIRNVEAYGMANVGFIFRQATRGRVTDCGCYDNHSDGAHVETFCSEIDFFRFKARNTGDDSLAVVSLVSDGDCCRDIRMHDCESRNSAARGFSVVGGVRISHHACKVYNSADSAVYKASEASYNTYGCLDCHDYDTEAWGCMANATSNHGIFYFGGRPGAAVAAGVQVPLSVQDCGSHRPLIRGCGAAAELRAGVVIDGYSERVVIDGARMFDLLSATSTPNMLEVSGHDCEAVDNYANNIGGSVLNVVSATGRLIDRRNRAVRICVTPRLKRARNIQPTNGLVHVCENADVQSGGIEDVVPIYTGLPPGATVLRQMTQDGVMQQEIDPERDGWSYLVRANRWVPAGFLLDLTTGSLPRKFLAPSRLAAGENVTMKIRQDQVWSVRFVIERDPNQYYQASEDWRLVLGRQPNSGICGEDYVAVDAGVNAYCRVKTPSTEPRGAAIGAWGAITMHYDDASMIYVTYTAPSVATTRTKFMSSFIGG